MVDPDDYRGAPEDLDVETSCVGDQSGAALGLGAAAAAAAAHIARVAAGTVRQWCIQAG